MSALNSVLNIQSDYIVNLKEIFEDHESIFLVMEYC
jgi:serine/threonine protein kinase